MISIRHALAGLAILPLLAACNAGGPSSQSSVPGGDAALSVLRREAQSAALSPLATATPDDLLYIGNVGNNSITVYRHEASGNTAPVYTIAGSKTGITNPGQLSEDAAGNLYVANGTKILVFAHGANGNVAPIRTIAGPLTGLNGISALTVDKTTGKIFVIDNPPKVLGGFTSLVRFPPNADGDVAPFARSAADVKFGVQLANDSTGDNVIEAHIAVCCDAGGDGTDTLAKQFANGADVPFIYDVTQFFISGVGDDPTTKSYVVSSSLGLYRLAESTVGNGPSGDNGHVDDTLTPTPISIITSDTCGGQIAIAPGPSPYTYVVGAGVSPHCVVGVAVYANGATGNAAPVRILAGSATKMNEPYGIYEGQ